MYRRFESCSSVFDENGIEVFEDDLIKRAYQKEFFNRLSHRKIHPTLCEYEVKTNLLAKIYVEEAERKKGPPIHMAELDAAIDKMKMKPGSPGADGIPADFYTLILGLIRFTSWKFSMN